MLRPFALSAAHVPDSAARGYSPGLQCQPLREQYQEQQHYGLRRATPVLARLSEFSKLVVADPGLLAEYNPIFKVLVWPILFVLFTH